MSGTEALAMPGEARKAMRPQSRRTSGTTNGGPNGWTSLPGMLFALARQHPDRPMLRYWRDGAWQRLAWGEFAVQVSHVAAWLRPRSIMPGDRVMLVGESRPEWNVADAAIMAIGAVTVPTYTTNTVADHAHILRDSGARAAIVSTAALAARVAEAAAGTGGLDLLVCMEDAEALPALPHVHASVLPWAEAAACPADPAMLMAEVEQIPAGRLACLIYTSGTAGTPRGVMLPHRAMLANREGVRGLIERLGVEGEPYLSFLPLSHSYEHTVGCFLLR